MFAILVVYLICGTFSPTKKKKRPGWALTLPSFSNILALLIKNWITMKRSPILLFFIFLLPGIFMVLTCVSVGLDPTDLPVGVLNLETNCSGVSLNTSCEADVLSCYFIDSLNTTKAIHMVNYDDKEAMMTDAATAKIRAHFTVPANFSHSFLKRLLKPDLYDEWIYFYGIDDTFPVRNDEKMVMSLDESDALVALVLRKTLTDALDNFSATVNRVCEEDLEDETLDLRVVTEGAPSLGREGVTYQEYIVPSFLTQIIYFLAMSLTSESFISERAQVQTTILANNPQSSKVATQKIGR